MGMPSNVDRLRAAYTRWSETRGQSAADWVELMSDDVEVRSIADGAPGLEFTGPRKGRKAAMEYFAALHIGWEMISFAADEFIAEGDRVAVFGRFAWRNRTTGKTTDSPFIHRWRFQRGKVAEVYEYFDTAKALAAATPDAM